MHVRVTAYGDLRRYLPATERESGALIELGATVCSPRSPKCRICPVHGQCAAYASGDPESIPPPKRRAARSEIECTALLVLSDDYSVILEKQPPDGLFANLWCLPMIEGRLDADQVSDEASRKYGWGVDRVEEAGEVKHELTHRDILMRIVRLSLRGRPGLKDLVGRAD